MSLRNALHQNVQQWAQQIEQPDGFPKELSSSAAEKPNTSTPSPPPTVESEPTKESPLNFSSALSETGEVADSAEHCQSVDTLMSLTKADITDALLPLSESISRLEKLHELLEPYFHQNSHSYQILQTELERLQLTVRPDSQIEALTMQFDTLREEVAHLKQHQSKVLELLRMQVDRQIEQISEMLKQLQSPVPVTIQPNPLTLGLMLALYALVTAIAVAGIFQIIPVKIQRVEQATKKANYLESDKNSMLTLSPTFSPSSVARPPLSSITISTGSFES
jgi:hypothetical protein